MTDGPIIHLVGARPQFVKAAAVLAQAGRGTARYILAHRIPQPVQHLLCALPAPWAAKSLSKAISAHAWTFVGSGRFRVDTPWCFRLEDSPLYAPGQGDWHAAVFETLYRALVAPEVICRETADGRFVLQRG